MSAAESRPDEKYALRSLGRALDLLLALADADAKGLGVTEIAKAIDVSKSTAFALLQALLARGFVADVRVGGSRHYRLGMQLVYLGDRAGADLGVVHVATPILHELTAATGLTSRLAVLDEGYAVAIARVDAPGVYRLSSSLGRRELPHCSALGKALLSTLAREDRRRIVETIGMPRRTERTIVDPDRLDEELALTARRGYAFDDEEDDSGVVCVGAAIVGRTGQAEAAISVTGLRLDGRTSNLDALGRQVSAHADRISRLIGGPVHAERGGRG